MTLLWSCCVRNLLRLDLGWHLPGNLWCWAIWDSQISTQTCPILIRTWKAANLHSYWWGWGISRGLRTFSNGITCPVPSRLMQGSENQHIKQHERGGSALPKSSQGFSFFLGHIFPFPCIGFQQQEHDPPPPAHKSSALKWSRCCQKDVTSDITLLTPVVALQSFPSRSTILSIRCFPIVPVTVLSYWFLHCSFRRFGEGGGMPQGKVRINWQFVSALASAFLTRSLHCSLVLVAIFLPNAVFTLLASPRRAVIYGWWNKTKWHKPAGGDPSVGTLEKAFCLIRGSLMFSPLSYPSCPPLAS